MEAFRQLKRVEAKRAQQLKEVRELRASAWQQSHCGSRLSEDDELQLAIAISIESAKQAQIARDEEFARELHVKLNM